MAKKKRKKWMKPRHRLVRNLLAAILGPIARARYGIRIEKFKEQGKRPYLILYYYTITRLPSTSSSWGWHSVGRSTT